MNGIDQETLARLKEVLEGSSDPVRQFLRGYAKGAKDVLDTIKAASEAA